MVGIALFPLLNDGTYVRFRAHLKISFFGNFSKLICICESYMPLFSEIFCNLFYFVLNFFCVYFDFLLGFFKYFAFFSLIWTDMGFLGFTARYKWVCSHKPWLGELRRAPTPPRHVTVMTRARAQGLATAELDVSNSTTTWGSIASRRSLALCLTLSTDDNETWRCFLGLGPKDATFFRPSSSSFWVGGGSGLVVSVCYEWSPAGWQAGLPQQPPLNLGLTNSPRMGPHSCPWCITHMLQDRVVNRQHNTSGAAIPPPLCNSNGFPSSKHLKTFPKRIPPHAQSPSPLLMANSSHNPHMLCQHLSHKLFPWNHPTHTNHSLMFNTAQTAAGHNIIHKQCLHASHILQITVALSRCSPQVGALSQTATVVGIHHHPWPPQLLVDHRHHHCEMSKSSGHGPPINFPHYNKVVIHQVSYIASVNAYITCKSVSDMTTAGGAVRSLGLLPQQRFWVSPWHCLLIPPLLFLALSCQTAHWISPLPRCSALWHGDLSIPRMPRSLYWPQPKTCHQLPVRVKFWLAEWWLMWTLTSVQCPHHIAHTHTQIGSAINQLVV